MKGKNIMKKKIFKKIPKFKNEEEEREFWYNHDSTDYVDWSKAKWGVFFDVKPTTRAISIRMPEITLSKLRNRANRMDVPYQSLIKQYVEMGLKE